MKGFWLLITFSFTANGAKLGDADYWDLYEHCKDLDDLLETKSKTMKGYRAKQCCLSAETQPFHPIIDHCYGDLHNRNDTCYAWKCSFRNFYDDGNYIQEGLKENCLNSVSGNDTLMEEWDPIINASIKECEDKCKFS